MKFWARGLVFLLASFCGATSAHHVDPDQHAKTMRPLAEKGHPVAQYNLGHLYAHGTGVKRDYTEAVKWYRLSAAQGFVHAQHELGILYANGRGVKQDVVRACMWSTLAAAKGSADAKKQRDGLVKRMKPAQIAEAEKLAGECEKRNFAGCD